MIIQESFLQALSLGQGPRVCVCVCVCVCVWDSLLPQFRSDINCNFAFIRIWQLSALGQPPAPKL